jgi:phosphate:Na+ symporter
MSLFQATAMIMGANIGTTVTAQIAQFGTFDIALYATLFAFIGAFMNMLCKKEKPKTIGLALAGLGLVFLSLDFMKTSMKVFSSSDAFTTLLTNVNNPFLLLFIGIGLTALLQSSSALTTILIAMVTAGLTIGRGPNDILYVVLGTNIGSCVTALLSSFGASTNGKRASLIHLMFNTFGSMIFFIVLLLWPSFMEDTFLAWFPGAPGTQIAMFHTFFNVLFTLLFCPFINVFVFIATKVITDKKEESHTTFIDERFLSTPAVALTQVTKEVARMGRLSIETLNTIKLKAEVLSNFHTTPDGFAYAVVTRETIKKFNVSNEEAASMVSLLANIEDHPVWALIIEYENDIRVRLRSSGPDVDLLANAYNGGGHAKASGASLPSFDDLERFANDCNELVRQYKANKNK